MRTLRAFKQQKAWIRLKNMSNLKLFAFLALFFVCGISLSEGLAATITAESCSLTDVKNAVNAASRGDTVVIPPGSCTWNDTVTINKAIKLQGAGSSQTKITSTFQANGKVPGYPFVRWSASSSDLDHVFRLTGFQFDSKSYTSAFRVDSSSSTYPVTLRIDNNRFINVARPADTPQPAEPYATSWSHTMNFLGLVKGVVDSNYFSGTPVIQMRRGADAWKTKVSSWDNGTDDNIFWEDNYFQHINNYQQILVGGSGGSYVARYNTFDYTANNNSFYYAMDTHGAQYNNYYAAFGAEVYGNKFLGPGHQGDFRAGIVKVFYNKTVAAVGRGEIVLWETYGPPYSNVPTGHTCPDGSLYKGTSTCGVDFRGQNVEKSYFWNNRYGTEAATGTSVVYTIKLGGEPYPDRSISNARALRENTEFWLPKANFDGTTGVGCGTLAKRPATCVAGVGYWATEQSCSSVHAGMHGPNPTIPIQGTLYRCGPTSTWEAYYKPYAYPHPLRSEDPESISAPKGFKLVN